MLNTAKAIRHILGCTNSRWQFISVHYKSNSFAWKISAGQISQIFSNLKCLTLKTARMNQTSSSCLFLWWIIQKENKPSHKTEKTVGGTLLRRPLLTMSPEFWSFERKLFPPSLVFANRRIAHNAEVFKF